MSPNLWTFLVIVAVLVLEQACWLWNRTLERKRRRALVVAVLGAAHETMLIDGPTMHALDGAFIEAEKATGIGALLDRLRKAQRSITSEKYLRGSRFAVLFLALVAAPALADEPPATDQVSGGAGYTAQTKGQAVPEVVVGVEFPVNLGETPDATARIYSETAFEGLEGETVELGDVRTFRAIRGDLWVQRRIGADGLGGSTYLALHGGGAARIDTGGAEPLIRAPLWYSADLVFERRSGENFPHRRLALGYGHSDLSSPPQRVPGTLRDAARDAVPRDIMVGGNVTVTTAMKTPGGTAMKVVVGGYIHRALWGKHGTFAALLSATVTFGKAS